MADLNFKAQIELIDKMTAPMRSLQSQAGRLGRQFGETSRQAKQLQSQQKLVEKFRKQSDAIKQTTERYKAAEERLAMLSSKMNSTSNPTRTLTKQFEAAGRSFARVENKLKAQRLALSQTDNKLQEAGFSTNKLADHERELAQRIEATNRQLGERRQRLERVNQIQQQSQQMGEMRNKAAALGAGGAAATYAAARFVQPGVDLETSMSKVQALTRLDKNSEQYKALEAQAKQLGSSTQFTSADAARGQAFLAMAGFTPKSIQAAMPGMLDLALAGNMDLDRTADIASNILTGMKMDPTKMTAVADVLSAAFTRANVDIGMLGETMKYAAPGASGLGVSLEEVAAMAGKLGDAGIQGSMGGTALRTIMSRLAAPPKAAAGAMHELGLQVTDANGNLRKMPDILQELHEKTKNMGNTERLKYLKDIAGEEAGSAMQVLVDKAGTGELQQLVTTLQGANGEATKLSKTMADNTSGDWKAMTSGLDAFRTSVFDANRDSIRGFMQYITALSQRMTAFANAHPELIAFLGKVFGILAIGAVLFGTVGAALLTVLGPMAMLRASLVTLGLPTTLTPLGMLSKAFGLVGTAVRGLGAIMMANPILAIVAAISIAGIYVWKNWDTLGPKFQALWNSITAGASALWQRITAIWGQIKQSVINYANQLWSGLGIKFNSGIAALAGIILAFTPVGLFIRVFAAVWNYFSGLRAKFRQYGSNILQGLKDGILSKANAVIKSITDIAGRIKSAFTGARAMDIHSPSRVFDKYGVNIMQGLGGGIWRWAKWPINKLADVASSLRKQSFDITPTLTTDTSPVQNLWDRVKSFTSLGNIQGPDIDANIATDFDKYNRVVRVDADTTAFDNKMAKALRDRHLSINSTLTTDTSPVQNLWDRVKSFTSLGNIQGPDIDANIATDFDKYNRIVRVDADTTAFDNKMAKALRDRHLSINSTLTTDTSPVQNLWDRVKSFTSLGNIQGPDIDANIATDFDKYNRVVRVDADTTAFDNKMANAFSNQTFAPKVESKTKLEALWDIAKRLPVVATAQRYLANYSPINLDTIKDTGRYFKRHDAINSQSRIATVPPISFDTRKTVLPGVGTANNSYLNSTSNTNLGGITININGATDPMTVAQQVRREIESIQRDMSARRRSRLSDID